MTDYIVRDTQLLSVANAIRTKGGTSDPMAFPDGFVSAVEAISTGGGSSGGPVAAKEVNFRDYDGTVVYSYTPAEFAALTAMPDNPDHSSDVIPLTAQGWNWLFTTAQAYVAKYGRLEVGQIYTPTDGKTHVLIHLEKGRTSPMLGVCPNGTVDVDWGDGTAHDTLTGTSVSTVAWTPTHNYATSGDYDIKLTCTGTMGFYGINSGNNYSGLLRYSTDGDSRNGVYQNAVRAVICGNGVTSIGTSAFHNCYGLSSITIPNRVTSIGTNAFHNCYGLSSITIPNSVRTIGDSAFGECYHLSSITIPYGVSFSTGIFSKCYGLSSITIPDTMTSMSIGTSMFQNCYGLSSITIPDRVTKGIGANAFQNCYGLAELHFRPTTPPTVANANAFYSIPTDCKIYVPAGSLEAYTTATNYPSASKYTYIEE